MRGQGRTALPDSGVMRVRRAGSEDARRLAEVHVLGWQAGYRGLLDRAYLDALDPAARAPRWASTIAAARWPERGVLIADPDDGTDHATGAADPRVPIGGGPLLGFASLRPTRDLDEDPGAVGEITSLYVRPQAWRQGVGRALVSAALESLAAAGRRTATLWVLSTNERAIAFYERVGWVADGTVKHDVVGDQPIVDLRYRRPVR